MISLKLLCVIILLNLNFAFCLKCEYEDNKSGIFPGYSCNVKPDSIDEIHLPGKSDENVKIVNFFGIINNFSNFSQQELSFCEKFENLEKINVDGIKFVDKNSLKNCQKLQKVWISRTEIQKLPENVFFDHLKLESLALHKNKLTTLPENIFINQNELTELNLFGNLINFLPAKIFNSLKKLQKLWLGENKIRSINPLWFKNLQNLRLLDLSQNDILDIPNYIFKPLTNLQNLDIYGNKIKNLHTNSFRNLKMLKILQIYNNKISRIPKNIFTTLENLEELRMDENKLTVIHSDSFGVLQKLRHISLSNNKIDAIDRRIISRTAVNTFNMAMNLCSQEFIKDRNKIEQLLRRCFENYEPREEPYSCGKSKVGYGNIIGGTFITRGAFPWIVALVSSRGDFFCGGTLISDQKVITAAHCIHEKGGSPKFPRDIVALLGVHDLKNPHEVGKISKAVQTITVHPDWNPNIKSYDADLAVLVLEEKVEFNEFIVPICLIDSSTSINELSSAIVTGYGKSEDESKVHENIPKILEIPIHTNEDCFFHNSDLVKISSKRTFCGGHANGSSVCRGDSGSGLVVEHENTFYLRGIVSASLFTRTFECDVFTYAVFTNMLKFYDWVVDDVDTESFLYD